MALRTACAVAQAFVCLALLLATNLQGASAQPPWALTTADSGKGRKIVDQEGNPLFLRGVSWYGFNVGWTVAGNLTGGADAVSRDVMQIVYRMKLLGFNAVRLPFVFDDWNGLDEDPINFTADCIVPTATAIQQTLVPPTQPASNSLPLAGILIPDLAVPPLQDGICNYWLPNDSTYNRYIWLVRYLISQGFYVALDYHSVLKGTTSHMYEQSLYNKAVWIKAWAGLLRDVISQVPEAQGKLLVDLINDPDGYFLTWEGTSTTASLKRYYLDALDALYPICQGCLFLVQGTGQTNYGINWGNGFATDAKLVSTYGLSDPSSFFQALATKPYVSQVVLAPHTYCPEVTGLPDNYTDDLFTERMDNTVGYLNTKGFCSNGNCTTYAIIDAEFGSTLDGLSEGSCFYHITKYLNARGIDCWFYWAWNPESQGTGGLVADNQKDILWDKVLALTDLGLRPWFTRDYAVTNGTVMPTGLPITSATLAAVHNETATHPAPHSKHWGADSWQLGSALNAADGQSAAGGSGSDYDGTSGYGWATQAPAAAPGAAIAGEGGPTRLTLPSGAAEASNRAGVRGTALTPTGQPFASVEQVTSGANSGPPIRPDGGAGHHQSQLPPGAIVGITAGALLVAGIAAGAAYTLKRALTKPPHVQPLAPAS